MIKQVFQRVVPGSAALLLATTALAFDPAEGTISQSSPTVTTSGGPYAGANPTPQVDPVCTNDGATCDVFVLNADFSDALRAQAPNSVIKVTTSWDGGSGADDYDIYIRNSESGEIVAQAASSSNPEVATITLADMPAQVDVEVIVFSAAGSTVTILAEFIQVNGAGAEIDLCVPDGEPNEGSARIDAGILNAWVELAPNAEFGAYVHFNSGTQKAQDRLLEDLAMVKLVDFRRYARSVYVQGPVSAFQQIARHPMVVRLEHNAPLRYFGGTAPWAIKARVAQEPVAGGPYFDAAGNKLTGAGVTVGIIDGGLNAQHPDFAGRVMHNYRLADFVAGSGVDFVDVGNDGTSEAPGGGHGTHVAGIAAGGGQMSDGGYSDPAAAPEVPGTYTGIAYESPIVNWGLGAGLVVLSADSAYLHLLDNLDSYDPPLRVVNNSYGNAGGSPYDPGATSSCLIREIIDQNVTMVFAAGNDGGDGSADLTSSSCKHPTPGVICVAWYDDLGSGSRNGPIASGSGRGLIGDPENYPDIAAPGDSITATCITPSPEQALCATGAETNWQPFYGTISGTSMASPYVTGALTLLAQARPDLTPADMEAIIQRTAHKIGDGYDADPQLAGNTINFAYGAGLLDVTAALDALGVSKAGLGAGGSEQVIIAGDADTGVASPAADVLGMSMQEMTVDGMTGIMHRIEVADAADLGAATEVALRIERSLMGEFAATTVLLDGSAVSIPEAGTNNNAVAGQASLDGNIVSVFVSYAAAGFPPVGEAIHNIRVVAETDIGAMDYAPSPDVGAELSSVQPMFGRPFSIQLPAGNPPPSNEKTCELPGLTQFVSPSGITGLAGSQTGHEDLRQGWIAEPLDMPGKLVFTLKTDNLNPAPIPSYRWYMYFNVSGDDNRYFVAMDTTTGVPTYTYGTTGTLDNPAAPVGTFSTLGNIDAASGYSTDGTITLVMDKSVLGIDSGAVLSGIAGSIRQTSNNVQGSGLTVDSAGAIGPYAVVGNETCASANGNKVDAGSALSSGSAAGSDRGASFGGIGGGALGGTLLASLLGLALLRRRVRL